MYTLNVLKKTNVLEGSIPEKFLVCNFAWKGKQAHLAPRAHMNYLYQDDI